MKPVRTCLAITVLTLCGAFAAQAQTSIGLGNYSVTGNYTLDALSGRGLEASAVTFARDRNSLFLWATRAWVWSKSA